MPFFVGRRPTRASVWKPVVMGALWIGTCSTWPDSLRALEEIPTPLPQTTEAIEGWFDEQATLPSPTGPPVLDEPFD
ncbi:MAG: hypothetical protein ACKOCN_12160, partial [Planctomycetaceae bacterium]